MSGSIQTFETELSSWPDGRVHLVLPFDPNEAWGVKSRHHVNGRIHLCGVRGPVEQLADGNWVLMLGPAWLRGAGLEAGDRVTVSLAAEGPQRESLDPDLAAALEAEPEAGAFFDSLATFYRKGYLRWLDGAKRRPEVRAERVREWIELLKAGKKTRER